MKKNKMTLREMSKIRKSMTTIIEKEYKNHKPLLLSYDEIYFDLCDKLLNEIISEIEKYKKEMQECNTIRKIGGISSHIDYVISKLKGE